MTKVAAKLRSFTVEVTDSKGTSLGKVEVRASSRQAASQAAIAFLRNKGVTMPTTVFTPSIQENHYAVGTGA